MKEQLVKGLPDDKPPIFYDDYNFNDEETQAYDEMFKKEKSHITWTSKMLVKVIAVVAMIFAGIFAYQTLN